MRPVLLAVRLPLMLTWPSDSGPWVRTWVVPPVNSTRPLHWLPLLLRSMVALPAFTWRAPLMTRGELWVTAPPACRSSELTLTLPSATTPAPLSWAAPPVRLTAPPQLLLD